MIAVWGLLIGLPLLAFGGALVFFPETARRFSMWYRTSKVVAAVLTTIAWFWTAYECDTIGIDAFDAVTKAFPGELWILAVVLSFLTYHWMPKNLPVRALTGIMMLVPAALFRTTHAYRPPQGTLFAAVDLFVIVAYIGAIIGMYGMFYPWRLEKGLDAVLARRWAGAALGAALSAAGIALVAIGFAL